MTGQSSTAPQQAVPIEGLWHTAAGLAGTGDYGALILDGLGRIHSCGAAAEKIFAASQAELSGRKISEIIANFFLTGNALSYHARYLTYLCKDRLWQKFSAIDGRGQAFVGELKLTRMTMEGEEFFVLNVHRTVHRTEEATQH